VSWPGRNLPTGKTRYPFYRRLGGPQGRSGQVRNISPSPGFDPRTVQPVGSRYNDYATRPTEPVYVAEKSFKLFQCWQYMMLYTATVDGTWCCIQLLLMVHDAVYSYCWWYTMLYTATVDGTWCCIQLLLMVHDAVYSYCWWYTMLYTATVDGTRCCIQLLLMVHDAVYSYCWWYMMLYTTTVDGTRCCITLLLIQLAQNGTYWIKLAYINMTLGPVTENRIIHGGQMSRSPPSTLPPEDRNIPRFWDIARCTHHYSMLTF
jgi:hypothetical protein